MEVCWYTRQNKHRATELFIIQLEAGAHSPQRALKAIRRGRKIQELIKNVLIQEKICTRNIYTHLCYCKCKLVLCEVNF